MASSSTTLLRDRGVDVIELVFSVRLPMMSKDEELAPIGAAPNQVSDRSH